MTIENVNRVIAGNNSPPSEYRVIRKDGTIFTVLAKASPAFIGNELVGIRVVSIDISERKKTDAQLEMINEKLHVLGSLIRHDVGNKLMSAKSNMYLLRKRLKDNPDLLKYVDAVDEAFNQSSRIFEFSKIYEQIGVEKPIMVNVAYMFDEAFKLIPHSNVEVVNGTQGFSVLADSMLQQLFYNLIDNSLKHGKTVSRIS